MRLLPVLSLLGASLAFPAHAAVIVPGTGFTFDDAVGLTIPDNNATGIARQVTVPAVYGPVDGISVSVVTSGGWNGDYYAFLSHSSGLAVLLNRIGRSTASPLGSPDSGMVLTLITSSGADVHLATAEPGAPLTGVFSGDGRFSDPATVLDTDPRTAPLDLFLGADASGTWTFFIADLSAGDSAVLESWSLAIDAVPEPSLGVLAAGVLVCAARRRRARRG